MHPYLNHDACPPDPQLRAVTARLGQAALCYLAGDLDADATGWARTAIQRAQRLPCPLLGLDLRDVTFIDCAGLNLLLEARLEARRTHRAIVLIAPSLPVQHLLRITATRQLFPAAASARAALAIHRPPTPGETAAARVTAARARPGTRERTRGLT
ncbi:STAS domain-containing protein [Kitasatospora sp. NPDC096147]|uniref:STAS domain-containing protein n=1 Tax=Kitasatospora sp. NPDC096147 TaxID=3364093 RepID=UPI00382F6271